MTVVGACAPNARELIRALLPAARDFTFGQDVALAADAGELLGSAARVGELPTTSRIELRADGLVLERGAAWTAPMYYRTDARVAATNLAPLVRETDTIDEARIATMVGFAFRRDEARSVYHQIRIVQPFETVVLHANGITSTMRAPPVLRSVRRDSISALARELRELLVAAVTKAAAGRRVGVMLSGGMDSSSVLAALLAARGANAREIAAVTIDFDAPGSDRPHVAALEKHYGLVVTRVKPAEVPMQRALVIDRSPSRLTGDAWALECAVRAHDLGAQLLMTGTGGDDFFGADMGTSVVDAVTHANFLGAWDASRARFPYRAPARWRARAIAKTFARPYLPKAFRQLRAFRVLRATPEWVGPLLRKELERVQEESIERKPARTRQERFEEIMRSAAQSEFGAIARAQTDSIAPIPRSDAIYDDDLLQFLIGVRQEALFVGGQYRGLLREAMRGLLPESVRTRLDKSDFEPALADAMWPIERFAPLLRFSRLVGAGIIHDEPFQAYLAPLMRDPHASSSGEAWLTFWSALSAEAFLQNWP